MNSNLIEQFKEEVIKKSSTLPIPLDIHKSVLLVIDMINDGCRKGGAFDRIGFDITHFQKIEPNIVQLVNACKDKGIPIIYVKSFYDPEYLPIPIKMKFEEMGIQNVPFARKGTWGVEFVDSLPRVNDYRIIKSHYSAFARNFSFAFKEGSCLEVEEYLKLTADQDIILKHHGKFVLNDLYAESSIDEALSSLKGKCSLASSIMINNFIPLTLHGLLQSMLQGVDTILCTGGSTHVCLASTIYSASERGYKVILPVDALAAEDETKHWVYLHNFSVFNSILCKTVDLANSIYRL